MAPPQAIPRKNRIGELQGEAQRGRHTLLQMLPLCPQQLITKERIRRVSIWVLYGEVVPLQERMQGYANVFPSHRNQHSSGTYLRDGGLNDKKALRRRRKYFIYDDFVRELSQMCDSGRPPLHFLLNL